MNRILFGVLGHVDHGKTALVRALTGMETDRLPEEKRRGLSIALGFAHAEIDGTQVDFIDMPGHERFVRTMVSGATGMQAALLVVAADEGIKPQTREHVDVAALLGVRRIVVALTKADLAEEAARAVQAVAATELLVQAGLAPAAVIAVSATTGEGLEALRAALAAQARDAEPPPDDGFVFLPMDRAFVMAGHGTVVTGTLRRGRLARGEVLEVAPSGLQVRVRAIQVHGQPVEAALPGQRVAVNLRGVEVEAVGRGAALVTPGQAPASPWLTVALTVPAQAPSDTEDAGGVANGARAALLVGSAETSARVRLLDRERLRPGETALAQLRCTDPCAAPSGERFVLRRLSPPATLAGGRVLDPETPRLRRHDPIALATLQRLADAPGLAGLGLRLDMAGAAGVTVASLARAAGLGVGRVEAALKSMALERTRGGGVVLRARFDAASAQVIAALRPAPAGLPLERLRAKAPGVGPQVFDEVLARLAAAGRLRVEGGSARLLHAGQERARVDDEAALAARLAETVRNGGLSPPDILPKGAPREVRRAVERLVRAHVIVRAYDRVQKREILFHSDVVEAARRTLAPHLTGKGLRVAEAGALLGVSRKYSVPLLEHLDAIQFTRRLGDRRTLGHSAAG